MTEPASVQHPSLTANARVLIGVMGPRRRLQLILALTLTFLGTIAELVTIGAVLPLLTLAANPAYTARFQLFTSVLATFGSGPGGNMIIPAALVLIAAAIMSAVLRLMLVYVTQKVGFGLRHDLAMALYGRAIRQPYEQIVRQNSSAILSGLDKISLITIGVIFPLITAVTSGVMAICIIALLFFINPLMAAIASFAMGLLYVAITLGTRRIAFHVSERSALMQTQRVKLIQESLGGVRDIILDHSEDAFEQRFEACDNEMRRLQILSSSISNAPRFVVEGSGISLVALLAIYFSLQPGGVLAALPVLGALALGAQRLMPLLQSVYLGWSNYSLHAHKMRDVAALLSAPIRTRRNPAGKIEPLPFAREIALRRVSYTYGGQRPALEAIDLAIAKGERVGLIGETGSGKSTLADLLMGLLTPSEGEMLVDGVHVEEATMPAWQAQIAHVPQAIFLADDTIAANIAFGSADPVDLDRIWEAADRADLRRFIETLPDGLLTHTGERGIRLSGGQRQRIGIARALYKKATVLVLDEATSALDDETEAAVMDSVTSLGRDLTIVMIAHRLSTVADCDTIYRLQNGSIVQKGSYQEVVLGTVRSASG